MDFSDDSYSSDVDEQGIQPYMYEPRIESGSESEEQPSSGSDDESEDLESDEENVDEWCSCGSCVNMPTTFERRCCVNTNVVDGKIEAAGLRCITEHEGFQVNCLNIHVLETSFYDYVTREGPMEEDQQIHELYRYLAYRRFTRWVYGLLTRKCRRVIPACAVAAIRERFPSEAYCGFKYPQ